MTVPYPTGEAGEGEVVEASLLRTGIYCLGWDLGLQMRDLGFAHLDARKMRDAADSVEIDGHPKLPKHLGTCRAPIHRRHFTGKQQCKTARYGLNSEAVDLRAGS